MRFPSSAGSEYQDVRGSLQPACRFGKLHHDCRVKTGNMGELKVRPGFSAGQLRFFERAGNPGLVAPTGFPFC